MDRASIDELFRFTDYSWRAHEDVIRPHGDALLTRAAPGSGWPALRDVFAHINWAYVRWLADPDATTEASVERVESWSDLDAYRRQVREGARRYFDSLRDEDLQKRRDMNVDGSIRRYSPADILVHVMLHERQHHGDINTLLYQLGMDVPVVEYRFSLPEAAR